ncbi:MAG: hypothetical protein PWQ38_986 [Proteiniphilum sp.]|nr:hypothetical protein [Proteiniphilum sp.]
MTIVLDCPRIIIRIKIIIQVVYNDFVSFFSDSPNNNNIGYYEA